MANRVLYGKLSNGVYGLKVSKKGQDVTTATNNNLLFDSTSAGGFLGGLIEVEVTSGNTINNSIGNTSSSYRPFITYNGNNLHYNTLTVVLEDATGQNLDVHNLGITSTTLSNANYSTSNSFNYFTYLGVTTTTTTKFTEFIAETGALYRMSAFYALDSSQGTTQSGIYNTYSFADTTNTNVRATVRSYCWSANSGDHGQLAYDFNESNTANQELNKFGNSGDIFNSDLTGLETNDFGKDKRLEFRKANGEALNDKFYFRDGGSFYTVAKENLGGLPVSNARILSFQVPLGYGFMRSEFMGF